MPPEQTGVASGINAVLRTVGGAVGAQIGATFIAANVLHSQPTEHGYNLAFSMATLALGLGTLASLAVPGLREVRAAGGPAPRPGASHDRAAADPIG